MKIRKDLSGKRFGKLLVLCPSQTKQYYFVCKCDCGNIVEVYRSNLGRCTCSCGCLQKERTSKANKTHGETGTRLFRIWNHMKQRCFNKRDQDYQNYGGRGISVCKEWEKYCHWRKHYRHNPEKSSEHTICQCPMNKFWHMNIYKKF